MTSNAFSPQPSALSPQPSLTAPMPTHSGQLRITPATHFAIIASRWNPRIVDALIEGAQLVLAEHGAVPDMIDLVRVPGAWEIPLVAAQLAQAKRYNAIIALGCVVRGDTRHYEHVADGCAQGLMRVALDHGIAVLNGVLAVERHDDAQARAGGVHGNKGADVALAAIEMVDLFTQLDSATRRDRKGIP